MKTFLAGLAWLILAGVSANAAEPASEMFAYGSKLEVEGQHAFYQLELPLEVYQSVTRRDLGDIRVFNAAGQVVPHALRRPNNTSVRKDIVTAELPFFPLRSAAATLDGDLSIHVDRNPQGTIIDIQTDGQKEPGTADPIRAYLIDTGSPNPPIDALELVWAEGTTDFLAEVRIETSHDLKDWRLLMTAAMARLGYQGYQGYQLDHSNIELPRPGFRYLRLSWPTISAPAQLAKVIAMDRQHTTINQPQRRWLKVNTLPVAGKPQDYLADVAGFLPVDTIQIQLAQPNSLAAARLTSAVSASVPQREHWRGLIYTLQIDGNRVVSPAISIAPISARYWTLNIDGSEAPLLSAPTIEFGWQPDRLVFLAQGDGPFLLAYGSGEVAPAEFPLTKLLQQTATTAAKDWEKGNIEPDPQFSLGGTSKFLPTPPPLPWKTWLLWSVLVAGVLLIGWMSLRLYQQLHEQDKNHPS